MRTVMTVAALMLACGAARADERPVSYDRDVDPLMKKYCATCHGRRTFRGNVSVVTFESLMRSKKGKALIVPGQPDTSVLLLTMEGKKPVMPPRKEELQPTKAEVALIRRWIKEGAKDDTPKDD